MNNQLEIPILGLGTWQIPNTNSDRVVQDGICVGYRHIDTANAYENEVGVGLGIRKSGIQRETIFVTSKIPAECKSYEEAKQKIDESLQKLNIDYIDLLLIHCPSPWNRFKKHYNAIVNKNKEAWLRYGYEKENLDVYKAMEEAVQEGKVRSIGLSNFFNEDTQNILDHCSIPPVVNQIQYHVGYEQEDIVLYCHKHNILIEAYSPIATGALLQETTILEMAKKYQVSVAQLSIRYAFYKTDIVLPKTTHKDFMIQNADIDFSITDEDLNLLHQFQPQIEKKRHSLQR